MQIPQEPPTIRSHTPEHVRARSTGVAACTGLQRIQQLLHQCIQRLVLHPRADQVDLLGIQAGLQVGAQALSTVVDALCVRWILEDMQDHLLLVHMQTLSDIAGRAAAKPGAAVGGLPGEFVHAGAGMLVLVVIQVLNMYKPRGMTAYGWRKQQERRTVSPAGDAAK